MSNRILDVALQSVRASLFVAFLIVGAFHTTLAADEPSPSNDIPPALTEYKGRTIAQTMHYLGAGWLTRAEREQDEDCLTMLKGLGVKPGQTVCDMGCGNGFYTLKLADMVGEKGTVYAVDIQQEMLRLLESRMEKADVTNIKPVLGSLIDPRLPEGKLDLILCVDVYHEFSHPEHMLAAMRKALKKDGRLVLVEFRKEDPNVPIKELHKMSKKQVLKELEPNGFKLVEQFDKLPWQHMMFFQTSHAADSGETLYNGIVLPRLWPPRLAEFPTSVEKDPVTPSYLTSPPPVIPIDVGRQLFVDDFLIDQTTLKRTFHLAKYHPASPVLKPDEPWEMKDPDHAAAMVFSDGVWYDPKDKLFKMWYMVGESASTGYATSHDGIHWDKPALDVRPPTNIVQAGGRDSSTVWLDLEEQDPARRFKMFRVIGAGGEDPATGWNNWVMAIHFSPDGIHWGEPVAKTGRVVDRSTVFWNPFRKVWVYSIRHVYNDGGERDKSYGFARRRSYVEGPDVLAAARWEVNEPLRWSDVDRLDPQRDDLKIKPQLYNLDAIAYESLMVGLFTIWRGQPADRHKPNNVVLGYSRDGWQWSRPDRRAFCPVSDKQGDWNANNVQSAGGGFLVVGDELYFYVSGRSGRPGGNKAGTCTTGLATLRRDGFASMDATEAGGTLTTRPVRFKGKHLFVNVDDPNGELRVEILNEAGEVMPRFAAAVCSPIATDKTLQAVQWSGVDDLSSLVNAPVRFRFHLKNGRLYAFWVSPESSGASHGYVAAGGPGFSSNRDTGRRPDAD